MHSQPMQKNTMLTQLMHCFPCTLASSWVAMIATALLHMGSDDGSQVISAQADTWNCPGKETQS